MSQTHVSVSRTFACALVAFVVAFTGTGAFAQEPAAAPTMPAPEVTELPPPVTPTLQAEPAPGGAPATDLPVADAAGGVIGAPLDPSDAPTVASTVPKQLTLWEMIQQGGAVLWVIMALSVVTFVMALYLFLTVTPGREAPATFVKRAMAQLRAEDYRGAYQMCEGRDEIIANVLRAGLKVSGHDRYVIQEAMESEGERGATALWQRISYLNNVGVIAPLLGLLGTVWGMIGAFGAIALDDASVKGVTMAYNVAKAMITTLAGLLLAIPAMVAYFYLRGRVIQIVSQVEAQASEMVELLARSGQGSS